MRITTLLLIAIAAGAIAITIAPVSAEADTTCPVSTETGIQEVIINGVCTESEGGSQAPAAPVIEQVGCMADGTAIYNGAPLPIGRHCGANVPKCMLLIDGGQAGPYPITALEYQELAPGTNRWVNLQFFCPQSTAPVPAGPDVAAIRDQVVRLLPRVTPATTGPTTLVNIQTLLWADTPQRRSLGQVTVVGQPVWLQLGFDHADWDFGDGTHTNTDLPGKRYDAATDPCRTVSCPDYFGHTFTHTGTMTITVRIAWHASYALDGQHYQPVDDTPITGPAGTIAIHVRQARGVLVSTGD